ncbi:MAG: hypothetical protein F6K30_01460 [Cyanothece sp. SIO2G6]|nr:hypothetical protein [Cyanothece sp. SIO2G6]
MASDLTRVSVSTQRAALEFELLQLVLKDEVYPWSMDRENDLEALTSLESNWAEALSDEENMAIATAGQQFFQQLDQAWQAADAQPATPFSLATLQASLDDTLQHRIPADLLQQLTQKAQALATQPITLAEQLVQCVQEAFPHWDVEDLQVLARPYAFAMRSPNTQKLELVAKSVRTVAWSELSEIEQARLSLAIVHYTLAQLAD